MLYKLNIHYTLIYKENTEKIDNALSPLITKTLATINKKSMHLLS
nr:hypothetical protein [Borrelia maritima]